MIDIEQRIQFKSIPLENQSYDFRRRNIQFYTSHMGSFYGAFSTWSNLDILLSFCSYVPQKT